MTKCLTCRGRLPLQASATYSGDFCSEFCFSTYPDNIRKLMSDGRASYQREAPPRATVDRILERNQHILRAFGRWRSQAPVMGDIGALEWMREKGFDFEYHTRVSRRGDGTTEVWCYEVGYRLETDGRVEPLTAPSGRPSSGPSLAARRT